MAVNFRVSVFLLASATFCISCSAQFTAAGGSGVVVNGQELSTTELTQLEQSTGAVVRPGQYWYDAVAGAYGCMGGPTLGRAPPGQQAAPLPAAASNGNTGVFLNGRELPVQDLTLLQNAIGTTIPAGHYWMRSDGSYGIEGNPTAVGTLASSSSSSGGGGGRGGCTYSASGQSSVCSDNSGFLSVSGEDSRGRSWTVSGGNRRKLLGQTLYNRRSRKMLQQVVSCPNTAGSAGTGPGMPGMTTPPAAMGTTPVGGLQGVGGGGGGVPMQGSFPAGAVSPTGGFTGVVSGGGSVLPQGMGSGGPSGAGGITGLTPAQGMTGAASGVTGGSGTGTTSGVWPGTTVGAAALGPGSSAGAGMPASMGSNVPGAGGVAGGIRPLGTASPANGSLAANLTAGGPANATGGLNPDG